MERTCARAVALGLPAVAFTEHADFTTWVVLASDLDEHEHLKAYATPDGSLTRRNSIWTGIWNASSGAGTRFRTFASSLAWNWVNPIGTAAPLHGCSTPDSLTGCSVRCTVADRPAVSEMPNLYRQRPAAEVVQYLIEIPRLIRGWDEFGVLAHIDYAVRYWPAEAGPFDPYAFEDEFRHALRALADSDRALEINTRAAPLSLSRYGQIVGWWREEGGKVVTLGSDAHDPTGIARGFAETAAMVEVHGFRPGRHPYDVWTRSG